MIAPASPLRARARGFTLTELAIVAMIVALLAGGLLMTLSAQNENRELVETRTRARRRTGRTDRLRSGERAIALPGERRHQRPGGSARGRGLHHHADGGGALTQPGFVPAITWASD